MDVTVQLFASLAEAAGARSVLIEGLPESATVDDLNDAVFARLPQLAALRESVIVAVNEEYVRGKFPVHSNDQIALIPPVSGGEDPRFQITSDALDIQSLHDLVLQPSAGAISLFVGVVRDNNLGRQVHYLEYEAYPPMALKKMREIANEIRERWPIGDVAMHHRTGRLEIGEASVAIAVSAPHRGDGIAACQYAIDRLKQVVPIWKKEVWTDGESWIEGSLVPQEEATGTTPPGSSSQESGS